MGDCKRTFEVMDRVGPGKYRERTFRCELPKDHHGRCGFCLESPPEEERIDDSNYWTRLEYQYAGQAIPAVVERHALDGHVHDEAAVARDAVALARALIAELRKGEVGDE